MAFSNREAKRWERQKQVALIKSCATSLCYQFPVHDTFQDIMEVLRYNEYLVPQGISMERFACIIRHLLRYPDAPRRFCDNVE